MSRINRKFVAVLALVLGASVFASHIRPLLRNLPRMTLTCRPR